MATALVETADLLPPELRPALRDLILALADSKRLLGFRYGSWILGAPELEAGIACASMAQDEWGHARLLYALLKDFGEDVDRLEHAREPDEYFSMEVLDREPSDWAGVVALNAFADTALSVQLQALRECCYLPLRQRTAKLIAEEQYHAAHGAAWARRYARASDGSRSELAAAAEASLPALLRWFGDDGSAARALHQAGAVDAGPDALRGRFLARVEPILRELGLGSDPATPLALDFAGYDTSRRRSGAGGPDVETVVSVRGDRNRDFLVD